MRPGPVIAHYMNTDEVGWRFAFIIPLSLLAHILLLWAMYGASFIHAPIKAAETSLAIQLIRTPGESGNIPEALQAEKEPPVPDVRTADKLARGGQPTSEMLEPRKQQPAATRGRAAVTEENAGEEIGAPSKATASHSGHEEAGKEATQHRPPRVLSSDAASESKPATAEIQPFSITPIYARKPEYPRRARRLGIEGKVLLHVLTALNGVPEKVTVISSSGYPVLDNAAVEAVNDWRFRVRVAAADFQGFPSVDIPINFKLN